jgi:hypothetical protein
MRYPIAKLPKAIEMVIDYELCSRRKYRKPITIKVDTAETFNYYCKGIQNKIGFVIDLSLILKQAPIDPGLMNRLQAIKGKSVANYGIQWGSANGDLSVGSGIVNTDKTLRPINPGTVIVKGYVGRTDHIISATAFFHPSNAMPIIEDISLSDRERMLMFVFAKLSGTEQAVALSRLNTTYDEIAALFKKQAIRHNHGGYEITMVGMSAASEYPEMDRW